MVTVNKLLNTSLQNATDMKAWLQQHQIPMNFSHNIQGGDMLSGDGVNNITGETAAISRVGPVLFDKIFREYTRKQWAREAAWMAPSVLERIPVHSNFEDRRVCGCRGDMVCCSGNPPADSPPLAAI